MWTLKESCIAVWQKKVKVTTQQDVTILLCQAAEKLVLFFRVSQFNSNRVGKQRGILQTVYF